MLKSLGLSTGEDVVVQVYKDLIVDKMPPNQRNVLLYENEDVERVSLFEKRGELWRDGSSVCIVLFLCFLVQRS